MKIEPCPHSTTDWCLECVNEQSNEIKRLHDLLDQFEISSKCTNNLQNLVSYLLRTYKNPFV